MDRVHIDFETRSTAELARQNAVGEHAYAAHESTQPLLLQYKTPEMSCVGLLELYKDTSLPKDLERHIKAGSCFVAHNARFEQAIWYWQMHRLFKWPIVQNWSCTAARARYCGLRASLEGAGSDLEIARPKDKRGDELIKLFCKPRKKIKGVIKKPWAEPWELPNEWIEFKQYAIRDVEAEMDIDALLPELPEFEQLNWELDYRMNWRGVPIDLENVVRAAEYCTHYTDIAFKRFSEITDGLRPTQRDRVLEYVQQRELEIDNLQSKTLKRLNMIDIEPELRECVEIRLATAMASVKKLQAMIRCTTEDGRARGLIMYYGAHTGRDSGKRIQPQNFKRGNDRLQTATFKFLDRWGNDWQEQADLTFPKPLDALASSMRGFIKAPKGKRLVVADYSQIEARILAWLAGAEKKLYAFRNGLDLYVQFASVLYNHTYESFFDEQGNVYEEFKQERQISKSAELGCGFGLGGDAFVDYCDGMDIVIERDIARQVVKTWRSANEEIVKYWSRIEKAAKVAIWKEGSTTRVGNVTFHIHRIDEIRWWLICTLPSGRCIWYYRPKLRDGVKWGNTPITTITFRTEWHSKSFREDTYGGKLTENIVQAIARDVMKVGVQQAELAGYEFILPVHDEGIFERKIGEGSYKELEQLMCNKDAMPWIGDCPITAKGHECERYEK